MGKWTSSACVLIGIKKSDLGNPEMKKFFSLVHHLVENQTALFDVLKEQNSLELLNKLSHY